MAASATLAIRIVSDAKQAGQGFEEAESRVAGFQRGLDKASVAAGGVLAGVGALAKQAYDAASNLQQSSGAIETVFGDQAGAVEKMAARSADAMGLSQRAYQENAALIGSQLQTLGIHHDAVIPTMDLLQGRAADLAATFGGSTSDAVDALSSALKGERDPIERYGIALSQSAIDAEIAARGLDVSTDAAKRTAGAQATLGLIMKQSANSHGAFASEADTAAGQTARAQAAWENASASLGAVLLPIVTEAAGKLSELAGFLVRNQDVVLPLIGVISGLAGTVIALNAAMRAYAIVQGIVNIALATSPLVWIAVAIIAIVAAVVIMYQKFDWFRTIIDTIGKLFIGYLNLWKTGIEAVVSKLSWVKDAAGWVGGLFSAPQSVTLTPVASGSAAGLFGAAAGFAPVRGAAMFSGAGGGVGPSAGSGPAAPGTVVYVTLQGIAVDGVSAGRALTGVLREYASATGKELTVVMGRPS